MSIRMININGTDHDIGGASAYDLAVKNGFEGTEEEWLASLKGEQGESLDSLVRTYIFPAEHSMTFEIGGLQSADGTQNTKTNRMRTDRQWCDDLYVTPTAVGVKFRFFFYAFGQSDTKTFKGCSPEYTESVMLTRQDFPDGASGYKLLCYYTDNREVDPLEVPLLIQTNSKQQHATIAVGGIDSSNGEDTESAVRLRSDHVSAGDLCVEVASSYLCTVYSYDADKSYLGVGASNVQGCHLLKDLVVDGATYVRFLLRRDGGETFYEEHLSNLQGVVTLHTPYSERYALGVNTTGGSIDTAEVESLVREAINSSTDIVRVEAYQDTIITVIDQAAAAQATADEASAAATAAQATADEAKALAEAVNPEYVSDVPENIGVLNAILNFKQLVDIQWRTLARVPQKYGAIWANDTFKGIPYSSTRPEALFVPNNVSFHTFMTALKNTNSYLYTVDLVEEYNNTNGNTYYGAVCSTSCAYALGIVPNYSTHQWTQIPDMEIIENQSAYGLKLCDTIVGNGHVVMVTDITRNKRGKIGHITITEAKNNFCQSTDYTPEELEEDYSPSQYTYCRYKKLYAVQHEQSPYVAVEDETPQAVTYNTDIIPRKGDKANWLEGVDVVLDVLNQGSYTKIIIYQDDLLYRDVDAEAVVTLSGLPAGRYSAHLSDDVNVSAYCYWQVVKATASAEIQDDGAVKVTFEASDNATPLWVNWVRGDDDNHGTVHISVISDADRANGNGTYTYNGPEAYKASLKVRVACQTDYGIIHSGLTEALDLS